MYLAGPKTEERKPPRPSKKFSRVENQHCLRYNRLMNSARARQDDLKEELRRTVAALVNKYRPEKIIAFGSFVQGKTNQWSDLDLAIVKQTDKRFIDRLIEVAHLVKSRLATDFVVYTPDEFANMAKDNYFVREEILGKGRVVYDKNNNR